MDRVATIVNRKDQADRDLAYWLAQSMSARIAAVEVLRQQARQLTVSATGCSKEEPRLQRVFRIVKRQSR
jgi:hypothetical protein